MPFKPGDIVKIGYAPHGCISNWAVMVGHIGIVREVHDDIGRALVQSFTIDGRPRSLAFMAVAALEPVSDPAWAAAATEYSRWSAQIEQQTRNWERRCKRRLQTIADRYGLSVEQIIEIGESLCVPPPKFEPQEEQSP